MGGADVKDTRRLKVALEALKACGNRKKNKGKGMSLAQIQKARGKNFVPKPGSEKIKEAFLILLRLHNEKTEGMKNKQKVILQNITFSLRKLVASHCNVTANEKPRFSDDSVKAGILKAKELLESVPVSFFDANETGTFDNVKKSIESYIKQATTGYAPTKKRGKHARKGTSVANANSKAASILSVNPFEKGKQY